MKDVDESACWKHGMREAIRCLRESQIFSPDELSTNLILANEPGVDILKPYNQTIGVLAGDTAHIDLSDDNDDPDDDTATNGLNRIYYNM